MITRPDVTGAPVEADPRLTNDEIRLFKQIAADVVSGRRIVCFLWKAAAIVGGIAVGTSIILGNLVNWHLFFGR